MVGPLFADFVMEAAEDYRAVYASHNVLLAPEPVEWDRWPVDICCIRWYHAGTFITNIAPLITARMELKYD